MRKTFVRVAAGLFAAAIVVFTIGAQSTDNMTAGKVELKSAGALAFGPTGILFVGDNVGGAVVALDTGDRTAGAANSKINVDGVDVKVAALVGVEPDQIMISIARIIACGIPERAVQCFRAAVHPAAWSDR